MRWVSGKIELVRGRVRFDRLSDDLPSSIAPLSRILDITIVVLMIAILLSVSLPVCVAVVENRASRQVSPAPVEQHRDGLERSGSSTGNARV